MDNHGTMLGRSQENQCQARQEQASYSGDQVETTRYSENRALWPSGLGPRLGRGDGMERLEKTGEVDGVELAEVEEGRVEWGWENIYGKRAAGRCFKTDSWSKIFWRAFRLGGASRVREPEHHVSNHPRDR